jgi:hypothetical protein
VRRGLAVALAVGLLLGVAPLARAAWASTSSGTGAARATSLAGPGTTTSSCSPLLSASVDVTWGASASGWTSYEVRWGTTSGGPYPNTSGVVGGLSYATPALGVGTWYFVVRSAKGGWRSADGNQVSRTVVSVLGVGLVCG